MAFFRRELLAIDLGTSNTRVYTKQKGLVISEPTLIVKTGERNGKKVGGEDAMNLLGRTNDEGTVIHPVKNSRICDLENATAIGSYFVDKAIGPSRVLSARCYMTVPKKMTAQDKSTVNSVIAKSGMKLKASTHVPSVIATALGAKLHVLDKDGSMIVSIGGGSTEVAVLSLGGIVEYRSVPSGGDRMNEDIVAYINREFNVNISEKAAENLKIDLGSALPYREEDNRRQFLRGRDVVSNLPQTIEVTASMIYEALKPACNEILQGIRFVLERIPPELAGDLLQDGIVLAGGGALMCGMEKFISEELGIKVRIAADPLNSTVEGLGMLVRDPSLAGKLKLTTDADAV